MKLTRFWIAVARASEWPPEAAARSTREVAGATRRLPEGPPVPRWSQSPERSGGD